MKKYILWLGILLCVISHKGFSQQKRPSLPPGNGAWRQVDSLEKKGLYRSAWDRTKEIYARAVRNGDEQQQIKALVYQLKYRSGIEEDAEIGNIREMDSVARQAAGIQKAILQSMLAELYWMYVRVNRYTLYDRLASASEPGDNIATWSLDHFYDEITGLYRSSLSPRDLLEGVKLKNLAVVVDTGENTLRLQPTLYDLLARRALDYFTGEEQNVIRPAAHFILDKAAAFAPALSFPDLPLAGKETTGLSYDAMKLYQQLIRFHLGDKDPAALIDIDLQRLQFVYRKAVIPGKDSIYARALKHIIDQYGEVSASPAVLQLAQWHFQRGQQFDAVTHPGGRDELKKALALCRSVPPGPVSAASVGIRRLKDNILRTDLSLQAEQVNVPGKPFRVLVTYKNASDVWFRLVKLPEPPPAVFQNRSPDIEYLLRQPVVKAWKQTFPNPGDFQSHRAEMKVDALPQGRYALLASPGQQFAGGGSAVENIVLFVSAISYVQNDAGDYLVLNRETGEPLPGATVHLWHTQYNADKRKNELGLYGIFRTDRLGNFRVESEGKYNDLMPEITWKEDYLFTGRAQWISYVSSDGPETDSAVKKTYLFTDRSIYRPGQTLYFKGMTFAYDRRNHKGSAIGEGVTTIRLVDVNNREIDSLQLTPNEFGSYAGSFVLPKGLLNGYMHLETRDPQATLYFSVEEYKRPTFYLKWDTAAAEYRLGDTVDLFGNVAGYNQAVIDGATVNYRVSRRTRMVFPVYRTGKMIVPPRSATASVAQGTATTDSMGRFNIRFPAIPDEETDSSLNPVFLYVVTADVTDINGESHSFSYELPLGYRSLELQLQVEDKVAAGGLDTLQLSGATLSGQPVKAPVTIRLSPLAGPGRYIRSRYWQQPDEFIMEKKEYLQYFPHDEYKNESDPASWEKSDPVFSKEDTTGEAGKIALNTGRLKAGWYVLEVTARDKEGRPVETARYLQVYDEAMKKPLFHDPLWLSREEIQAQPGDRVSWLLTAGGDGANIFMQDERLEEADSLQIKVLPDGMARASLPVTDRDRGGIIRHYVAVRYNRLFTGRVTVRVPWQDKRLHIRYETFRDKLLPGGEEQWKVKITGEEGEKVSAELLASMYDASLDAFRPHHWTPPDIYPVNYGKLKWQNGYGFGSAASYNIFSPKMPVYPRVAEIYPALNWFGYHPGRRFPSQLVFAFADSPDRGVAAGLPQAGDEALSKKSARESGTAGMADTVGSRETQEFAAPRVRENFNETAFFFPQLHTDKEGGVVFSFTMPDALTRWKLMMFAHTKDLRFAFSEKEAITSKPLMVQANAPRFVRQGDQLIFSAKVSNTSPQRLKGNVSLELTDLSTGEAVDSLCGNGDISRPFAVEAGQSTAMVWTLDVPADYTGALGYKLTASAGDYHDGEQNALPVLTNRILVTESLPMHFRGNGDHQLNFAAIQEAAASHTAQPQGITIEYTGNPVWYAVQALPFLDEPGKQSADACFDRVYAQVLSGFVAERIPGFGGIMQQWLAKDTDALKSPLSKNEELKTVLLEETPWVQSARQENAQKEQVAAWYRERGAAGLKAAADKLKEMQLSNGGFGWFPGMPDDRFITQRIVAGLGRLIRLEALPPAAAPVAASIVAAGAPYLDARIKESYEEQVKRKEKNPALPPLAVHYLYMRSFFPHIRMADSITPAYTYYQKLAVREWVNQPVYLQALIALAMHRSGDNKTAQAVLRSLAQTAIRDPVKGMHWKATGSAYNWYQAPVEAQAACIEAFHEIAHDENTVDELRSWLLSQKQVRRWPSNSSTADAVYALLLTGTQWAEASPRVTIGMGPHHYTFGSSDSESGTQYEKQTVPGGEITPDMSNVNVHIADAAGGQPTWGAVYFQYFEDLRKIGGAGNVLNVGREIALERTTPEGPKLIPVGEETPLKVGDKVRIRLTLQINQDMDYVHLKDVRASCMEPVQTISRYYRQGGVGYYSTATDAAMHYYFPHLPRGTYVFTYPVYITHAGDYAGGLSTLECLYAPSMRAHSEGVGLQVAGR